MNSLRVLFVNRNSPESEQICSVLAGASHVVLPAGSLDEASEALFVQKFDAVLLGPSLPLTGLREFSANLRQLESNQRAADRIPILSLSSRTPDDPAEPDCRGEFAVDGYLSAPFEPAALTEAVRSLAAAVKNAGSKEEDEAAKLAAFEIEGFREQVGYDADLLVEIIDLFLAETLNQIPAMRDALACADYGQLRSVAHTIKGSFGSLHAPRARFRAQELEGAARSECADSCRILLLALEAELDILRPQLLALRNATGPC